MNMKDFTIGYELDDTGLLTEEARRAPATARTERLAVRKTALNGLNTSNGAIRIMSAGKLCASRRKLFRTGTAVVELKTA